MSNKTKEEIAQAEALFQDELKIFRRTSSKEAWDSMFMLVIDCCRNIIKKKLKNVYIGEEEIENKALDSACQCMQKIKEGQDPQKLSSFCYTRTLWELYSPQLQFNDKELSLDRYIDDSGDISDESTNYKIYK